MTENKKIVSKPVKEKLDPMLVKISLIVVFGSLAPLLDSTMVNIAIKTISVDLKSILSVIQWVTTGYVLAMAVAVPISGWAINRFGGKKIYIFSLFIFLLGSIFSALSWNIESLIIFRFFQGIGAGLMMPTLQTMLVQAAGGRNLGSLMSIVSVPAVLGPILGPMLGGFIITSLSWRWIFYINIPITIIALVLALYGLPKDKHSTDKQSLDIIGILFLSSAFAILIYGISQISSHKGLNGEEVLIPLIMGLLLLFIFVLYALKTKGRPVIDMHLFKQTSFSASGVLLFISGIATNGAMFLLPLFYQQVRGETVLLTGIAMIPQGLGMLLTRSQVGKLTDRIGARVIVLVSLIVTVIGTLPFAFADSQTSRILLTAALFIRGAGLGGVAIPIMASAYLGLNKKQIPEASIATRILQTIGGAFGSAVLATIVQHQLSSNKLISLQAVSSAYNVSFLWSIGFSILAIVPAMFLPKGRMQ